MVKPIVYSLAIALLIATSVMADAPPAHPEGTYQAGWGMCPVNWENRYGSFQADGIWRPGHNWVVGYEGDCNQTPIYIQYDPICLDLWIELYCMQTYEFTNYEWHRIGDQHEDVTFYICGIVSSNNPEWVGLVRASQDLDRLHFMGDIFGNDHGESDISIDWHYAWGSYDRPGGETPPDPRNLNNDCWHDICPGNNGNMYFQIPEVCDHWFCWKGEFTIAYHQADGHYQLHMAGCPAPGM
jgi:hypothetical protein